MNFIYCIRFPVKSNFYLDAILSFLNNDNYKAKNLAKLSLVAQMVKNLPAMQETWVHSLGWEDPLEENMATHSSVLPWRILMDRGAWWLQSMESQSQTRETAYRHRKKVLYIDLKNASFLEKKCTSFRWKIKKYVWDIRNR